MHGDEMIEQFKKRFSGHDGAGYVPVFVYSFSGMDYSEKVEKSGADEYLGKPADSGAVITAIRRYQMEGSRPPKT